MDARGFGLRSPAAGPSDSSTTSRGHLQQHFGHWHLCQIGPRHTGDGQALIAARLVRVLPEIAAWAASLPPGILALEPWLTPAHASRTP